jgi:hypothetical protein
MATVIRPVISDKKKYWVDKHKHYELKHFCLQYPTWKKLYFTLNDSNIPLSMIDRFPSNNLPSDPTAKRAMAKLYLAERIDLVERIAIESDPYLYRYILRAVTEGLSYTQLKAKYDIPCGKDMYYDRYRKFFWLLSMER